MYVWNFADLLSCLYPFWSGTSWVGVNVNIWNLVHHVQSILWVHQLALLTFFLRKRWQCNLLGKSRNRRTFSKIENLRFLQNYDDYNCVFGIKLKCLSLSFIWRVMQWNQNVLTIKFSEKKTNVIFAKKRPFKAWKYT